MSEEFIKAEMKLFLEQCKEVDIVICSVRFTFYPIRYSRPKVQLPRAYSHSGVDPWFARTEAHRRRGSPSIFLVIDVLYTSNLTRSY